MATAGLPTFCPHVTFGSGEGRVAAKTVEDLETAIYEAAVVPEKWSLDVAQSVAAGLTVAEIARTRGRSVATVRNQLRSVMAKTASTRQADLILLLGTLAART